MRLVRDYPIRHARSSPTGHFFFAIFPRHPPTQPFPWVGPSNAPFGSEKRPFFRTHPSRVLRPSMPGAVFLEGPAFFPGTFHARGRFSGRCCGTDRVSDPTLLRFFKSMISGPRRVWGIRPPVSRRYFLCLGRELKYWWLSCILGGYRTICLSSG